MGSAAGEPETMIGGGSGRSAGAFTAAGASATTGAFATTGVFATARRRTRGARAVSGARGDVSPLARRRSIAARARSLASRRSSGAAAVSRATGAAAATGAAGGSRDNRSRRGVHGLHGRRQYDPDLFLFARRRCLTALVGVGRTFGRFHVGLGIGGFGVSGLAVGRLRYRAWRQPLLRLWLQSFPGPSRPPPAVRQRSSP